MSKHNLSQLPHSLLEYLQEELAILSSSDSIHECGDDVISRLAIEPDVIIILAHQKLHVFPFNNVPICWRRAYEEASLWRVVKVLDVAAKSSRGKRCVRSIGEIQQDWIDEVVKLCDMALIMTGGPGRRDCIMWVMRELEKVLTASDAIKEEENSSRESSETIQPEPLRKRMKLSLPAPKHSDQMLENDRFLETGDEVQLLSSSTHLNNRSSLEPPISPPPTPHTFPTSSAPIPSIQHTIPRLENPSLDTFNKHMHDQRVPVILAHTIDHWPALKRWSDPNYWKHRTIGGRRLVPIELGRSYTDEGWGQKIARFGEFLDNGLLCQNTTELDDDDEDEIVDNTGDFDPVEDDVADDASPLDPRPATANAAAEPKPLNKPNKKHNPHKDTRQVYLAQHDLLSQIPVLRNDIVIPDYCYLAPPSCIYASESTSPPPPSEPLLNIWLGPASTISPCHTDPHHNILAQVFGRKHVRLFAPAETPRLYPMGVKRFEAGDGDATKTDSKNSAEVPADEGINMSNTSLVDISCFIKYTNNGDIVPKGQDDEGESSRREQLQQYPLFKDAKYIEGILEAGECLYIPPGWWHYVQSLSVSCSVSFWWD